MKTDDLLDDLSSPPGANVDALIVAARAGARRRRLRRSLASASAIFFLAGALLWHHRPERPRSETQPPAIAAATPLDSDELLDSFGDRPVILVTYPDGTQRLIAVIRPEGG